MILTFVLYQNASTSQILVPSPQSLISSTVYINWRFDQLKTGYCQMATEVTIGISLRSLISFEK